ncbi:hypothetical protein [Pseudoxanthomonas mexicana]
MPQDQTDPLSLREGRRKYAAFFELGGKWQKELSVGEELVRSLNAELAYGLQQLELHEPDPPDLSCRMGDHLVALEVTELVCLKAVKVNQRGKEVYREWRPGEAVEALRELLYRKDKVRLQGGPFAELWVCIFTDEFVLTPERMAQELVGVTFGPFEQVVKAFLLFSYEPGKATYPVVPLQLGA